MSNLALANSRLTRTFFKNYLTKLKNYTTLFYIPLNDPAFALAAVPPKIEKRYLIVQCLVVSSKNRVINMKKFREKKFFVGLIKLCNFFHVNFSLHWLILSIHCLKYKFHSLILPYS